MDNQKISVTVVNKVVDASGAPTNYKITIGGVETVSFSLLTSSSTNASVPEFPTVALPVAGILGLLFIFGRKKEGL